VTALWRRKVDFLCPGRNDTVAWLLASHAFYLPESVGDKPFEVVLVELNRDTGLEDESIAAKFLRGSSSFD